MTLRVKFWGVRGSIPCPEKTHLRYGGNTSCVEVRCGDHIIILDAGTGIRTLGQQLQQAGEKNLTMLLTHTHFDHISGLPFFAPAYDKSVTLAIYAAHLMPESTVQKTLHQIMAPPFFPVSPAMFKANIQYTDFTVRTTLTLAPALTAETAPLNHPDRATAYRLNYKGKSMCYVTDTEHKVGELDANIVELLKDADLLIYDAMFTDETYPKHKHWGHSTWQEAVRLCNAANVKGLALFHHNPDHTDDMLDAIQAEAQQAMAGAFVAFEGQVVVL
jgi:phosphoribosyl 1,2-cyclic phosphodiesterase